VQNFWGVFSDLDLKKIQFSWQIKGNIKNDNRKIDERETIDTYMTITQQEILPGTLTKENSACARARILTSLFAASYQTLSTFETSFAAGRDHPFRTNQKFAKNLKTA
jgi:hypothetical protein